jgi:L-ascorbate metabolism protein UlaG (beta-lactamase superfamily)
MQLFWHGFSCVRIESSFGGSEATLVTDPYASDRGLRFPRTLAPDIVVLSHQDKKRFPLDGFTNEPFVIADPGEYEIKGIFAYGFSMPQEGVSWPNPVVYRFEIEGMSVGFIASLTQAPTDEQIGRLESIDVLLLPVGGGDQLNAKQAMEVINEVEPRIVVPLGFHVDGVKEKLGTVDAFCKELGVCQRQDANKLKITRKDLPAEDLVVAVLERA